MRLGLLLAVSIASTAFADNVQATLWHYNIQYVAGGMTRFPDGKNRIPDYDLTEAEVEDRIIAESFEPVLDIYLRHPAWKVDLELQGLMIEVMAARHPAALAKLRALVDLGQVELVSWHYSDQLFLAYPRRDMVRSIARNKRIFQQHGLVLSGVVFTQEGQFNEGMLDLMREHGYTTAVLPKNLLSYQHADEQRAFFRSGGIDVAVGGRGGAVGDLSFGWSGPGDGELIVTSKMNPYAGKKFFATDAGIGEYEGQRVQAEDAGVRFVTITELVELAKQRGAFPPMPPINDGTWQPNSTRNLYRWMGGLGGLTDALVPTEKDSVVLATNLRSSMDVAACEAVVAWAQRRPGDEARRAALEEAERELLLAQVSDSTGWNPWLAEVNYSLEHAHLASEASKRCIDAPELRGPARRRIDLAAGTVSEPPAPLSSAAEPLEAPPLEVKVEAPGRTVQQLWSRTAEGHAELTIDVSAAAAKSDRSISAVFPVSFDRLVYVPALDEDRLIDLPAAAFTNPEHTLPLPTGLMGIGPNRFLIESTRHVHVTALLRPQERLVDFRDDTVRADEPQRWRFVVVDGDFGAANSVAKRLNLQPVLEYELSPRQGCGCGGAPTSAAEPLMLLLGAASLRCSKRGARPALCRVSKPARPTLRRNQRP
ncbi:MAG: hypothetical protein HYZ28_22050 [Myxococcales bacterium]|nr:hypothetical protein [Myxococcales bacterium]